MQTKCRFYTRAKNDAVPGGTFEKGPSKGVTNLCFFWKLRRPKLTRERQNDSRGVRGGYPSRKYQLQHNYVWRTMRERRQKKRERRRRRREAECVCGSGRTLYDSNDWFVERTYPKGLLKSFELLTPADTAALKGEERWRRRSGEAEEFKAKENSFRLSSYNLILNVLIDWPENGTRSKP